MVLKELNLFEKCRDYHVPLWQCPQFLFVVLGAFICLVIVISYLVGAHYVDDPAMIALAVLFLTGFLLIIDFLIVRSFERLAEANRMKSEFVSVVSHQLRSPISNLSWTLEVLTSGKAGEVRQEQLEYFTILKENINRMKDLAGDLLVVSRIETLSLPIKETSFRLEEVTESVVDRFKTFSAASNVEVRLDKEPDLPSVWGDPEKIELVIENLLDNAIRYSDKNGKVEISLTKEKKMVLWQIKDNGVGIPKHEQKYIFSKFFRAKNAVQRKTQGSGLGLFIAQSLIQKLGGKMSFKSEEGEGATFWFTLPIYNAQRAAQQGT